MQKWIVFLLVVATFILLKRWLYQRSEEKYRERCAWKARALLKDIREKKPTFTMIDHTKMIRHFTKESGLTLEQIGTSEKELSSFES